jgi:hypothetical protein
VNFDLPIVSPDAKPEFRDAKSCAAWLQALPLINVGPSHGRLLGEIEELNCCSISPAERLKILETLRDAVLFVQTEHGKKFANRSVPLAKPEREIFMNVLALWTAYGHGYLHCLQALAEVTGGLLASSTQLALVCQRALWCETQKIAEHYRCYQEVGAEEWARLHRLYAFAEERKLVDQQVEHPVHKDKWKTTCMETYSQPLLLHLANPNEQSSRQLGLAARWLDRWGANVRIKRTPAAAEGKPATPLVVDLGGSRPPVRAHETPSATLRFLDASELDKSLRMRIAMLKKGDTPSKLNLGDDVPAPLAEHLLSQLHRLWCEDMPPRSPQRKSASATAELASGMGAMHFYITSLPFRQPGEARELSKTQREEIATFGRTSTRGDEEYEKQQGFTLEQWHIRDESLAGLRLERIAGPSRFVHTQLVAVRPADARTFILGTLRWLLVNQQNIITVGMRTIPGVPQGIAIRATGLNAMADKFVPALMLSAVPALRSPASLVLPVGWFRPKRVIEVFSDQSRQLQLNAVAERGADFERVFFEVI